MVDTDHKVAPHSNGLHKGSDPDSTCGSHSKAASRPQESTLSLVSRSELDLLIKTLANIQQSGLKDHPVSDRELFMLLFTVLENVASLEGHRGTSRVPATLRLLQSVTALFEDMISQWMQLHQQSSGGTDGKDSLKSTVGGRGGRSSTPSDRSTSMGDGTSYSGVLHLARLTLRLWLKMVSQVQHSSLQEQQLRDLQPLLSSPLETISKACYNLQQVGVFKGTNQALDQELSLIILEGVYSALFVVNCYPSVSMCRVEHFCDTLRDTLTDSCQEWFAYLCSKLHGISKQISVEASKEEEEERPNARLTPISEGSDWSVFLSYSHGLLTYILAELLTSSSLIKISQQALKQALVAPMTNIVSPTPIPNTSAQPSNLNQQFPFFQRSVTYSLEVASGFDKLTLRLSKLAELLLSIFKEQPEVQLLSVKLLSETTKDMVGAISSFLSSISDPNVYKNPDILDPYLEMLEEIWFRLSPDYGGSAPWWKKLTNYSLLLMECEHEVVCQVIYHLQCLFSHDSSMLKSELTSCVVIPYHQHLMGIVKTKCFKPKTVVTNERERSAQDTLSSPSLSPSQRTTKSPSVVTQMVQMGTEDDLEHNERVVLSLFLKLLVKVVSHPRSLGSFASNGTNLYSLFLLFPLSTYRAASLRVLEECLCTIHRVRSSSSPNSASTSASTSPNRSMSSSPVGSIASLHMQQQQHGPQQETYRPDRTGIQTTLLHVLLSMAYSVEINKIPSYCISIAEGRATLQKFGLAEADEVHSLLLRTFEHTTIKNLLRGSFISHISVMADIWRLLAKMTTRDDSAAKILRDNHIWDVVQAFGPALANVLPRLHQRLTRNAQDLQDRERETEALQERAVSLLADLLTLAHYMCSAREQRVSGASPVALQVLVYIRIDVSIRMYVCTHTVYVCYDYSSTTDYGCNFFFVLFLL